VLSYQHSFHAGNLADVHKHSILAWTLDYIVRKPKPITYIETHAGRGLYDLKHPDALKTGEAERGIARLCSDIPEDHPLSKVLTETKANQGLAHYPGSPLIALSLLRPNDRLHLAELHPQEHQHLKSKIPRARGVCYAKDGYELALSLCPPSPRRGILFIDPSYEVETDYTRMHGFVSNIVRRWNVGLVLLWYPILTTGRHIDMLGHLARRFPDATRHEVRFDPARKSHGMIGSGMFVVNPPYGLDRETKRLSEVFESLAQDLQ